MMRQRNKTDHENSSFTSYLAQWPRRGTMTLLEEVNVVCCVGRVEIQMEIQKGRCTANTDSIV